MHKYSRISGNILLVIAIGLIVGSCLDQEIVSKEEEAQKKYQTYLNKNNYTKEEDVWKGVYVKVITPGNDPLNRPEYGNSVKMKYTGKYTDGTIFETTEVSESEGIPFADYQIYGPRRHKVGALIVGLDTAIRSISKGTTAEIVIPHQYAFGNYEPVVYTVELIDIIVDDSTYQAKLFDEFMMHNNFSYSDTLAQGLYYKLDTVESLNTSPIVKTNDIIEMSLTARYAEVYDGGDGRQFYPRIGTYESAVFDTTYLWGSTSEYPIIPAIDSAIKYMQVGQTIEIAFKSGAEDPNGNQWGYGLNGKIDPLLNFYIIPFYMPLYYEIKFLGIKSVEE